MKILLCGGGTAGHITPLLAVARDLRALQPDVELHFVGQKGDKNIEVIEQSEFDITVHTVSAGKFRRYHDENLLQRLLDVKTNILNLRDFFRVVAGYSQSRKLLRTLRPDVAFFKGGFVAVPVGRACRHLKIPYITHDSDTAPGLANRLIAGSAYKHAVAHEGITAYPKEKIVVTGIPLSAEYSIRRGLHQNTYRPQLGLDVNSQVVFVFTGTQGARIVDDALEQCVEGLLRDFPKLVIVQVFGRLNEGGLESRYEHLASELKQRIVKLTFINNAFDYISAADIVVGRAGATTTAECATIGRCSIIIPAEQLSGGHQLSNAESMGDAVLVVREGTLPKGLDDALRYLLTHEEARKEYEEKIKHLVPMNASETIARLLINSIKGGRDV
jgi:UDP-N-acetylglucosamine--N-acetylmuramyl-(pentapeptide) pyrophosphoryl-undecaprenol N-acetylglucosamine transferase